MSYISVNGLSTTNSLVISFWFRAPQASIDKAAGSAGSDALLSGILPLVVMGKNGVGQSPTTASDNTVTFTSTGSTPTGLTGDVFTILSATPITPFTFHVVGQHAVNVGASFAPVSSDYTEHYTTASADGSGKPTNPSFIGIDCSDPSNPRLKINFETGKKPSVSGWAYNKIVSAGAAVSGPGGGFAFTQGTSVSEWKSPPFGLLIENDGPITEDSNDIHDVYYPGGSSQSRQVSFTDISDIAMNDTGAIYSDQIAITPDKWHHVVVSLDLRSIQTHGSAGGYTTLSDYVDSASRIFVAVDDVNYTKFDLSSQWVDGGADSNAVITDSASQVAGTAPATDENGNSLGVATYALVDPTLPLGGQSLGMPATAQFVNNIFMVEMGEMQLFTDVTMDTAKNRNIFIKPPDKNGVQKPASPSVAAKFFGKKPEVKFHSVSDWKKARNAGTASGPQHTPGTAVGQIDSYKPKPNLGGDQGS